MWSAISISSISLKNLNLELSTEADKEPWKEVPKQVVDSTHAMIKLKGREPLRRLDESVMKNLRQLRLISTTMKHLYGVKDNVLLSVYCQRSTWNFRGGEGDSDY